MFQVLRCSPEKCTYLFLCQHFWSFHFFSQVSEPYIYLCLAIYMQVCLEQKNNRTFLFAQLSGRVLSIQHLSTYTTTDIVESWINTLYFLSRYQVANGKLENQRFCHGTGSLRFQTTPHQKEYRFLLQGFRTRNSMDLRKTIMSYLMVSFFRNFSPLRPSWPHTRA